MFEIIRTLEESVLSSDYVAIGNLLKKKVSTHSAFIIQRNGVLFEFHYTGQWIEFKPLYNDYYHKVTETIHKDEVPAFIAQCVNITKKANPEYGFFYSGETYDQDGNHLSSSDLGERMTCAGFCLNVLKGFLEDEYLEYSDWDSTTHDNPGYLEYYCKKHNLDLDKVKAAHRRITPRECLISCFFETLPIRKADIDSKQEYVTSHFLGRFPKKISEEE